MLVTFSVTTDDIANGKRGCGIDCAASLALKRELPEGASVYLGAYTLRVNGKPYSVPVDLSEWVIAFDTGMDVVPRAFSVEIDEKDAGVAGSAPGGQDGGTATPSP